MFNTPIREALQQAHSFDSDLARANSSYAAFENNKLVRVLDPDQRPSALMGLVHDSFRALVLSPQFSCVGAKAAMNRGDYRMGMYSKMNTPGTNAGLARDLFAFVQEQPLIDSNFTTFIASFAEPHPVDEVDFERLLWQQLQSLHDLDAPLHPWDPSVSSDPANPAFSFSFAGRAFFIVGLSPASSRWTRRFAWPTLVFNAHTQFEQLRECGKYKSMQATIRAREYALQGSFNALLSDFGEQSEARQYAGRSVEQGWQCQFHSHP
ncbi:MAG: YqcI/YcgG family protein [Chloroflexota bacterium]|nr:YqcI/YcgG family protein [Chloroflexota bacterium]